MRPASLEDVAPELMRPAHFSAGGLQHFRGELSPAQVIQKRFTRQPILPNGIVPNGHDIISGVQQAEAVYFPTLPCPYFLPKKDGRPTPAKKPVRHRRNLL